MSGCSLALSGPQADRPANVAPDCDTGKGLVGVDGVLGTLLGITALSLIGDGEPEGGAITGLLGAAFLASAVRGNTTVNECREAFADYEPRPQLPDDDRPRVGKRPGATPRPAAPPGVISDLYDAPPVDAPPVTRPPVTRPPVAAPPVATTPVAAPPVAAPPRAPARPVPPPPVEDDWTDFWTEVTP